MSDTYVDLRVHIVFATRDRAGMIADAWRSDFEAYLGGTLRGLNATPIAVGSMPDHVHALVGLRSTQAVADVVRELKKATSAWCADRGHGVTWQAGYGAFSASHSDVPAIAAYIRGQREHHRERSSLDELRAMLVEAGVPYDERYFE